MESVLAVLVCDHRYSKRACSLSLCDTETASLLAASVITETASVLALSAITTSVLAISVVTETASVLALSL